MAGRFTLQNLADIKNSAPDFGLPDEVEARFAREPLEAKDTGLAFHRLAANTRLPFGHKHEKAEEVYVVLKGSGRLKIDDDVIDVVALDAVRVDPGAVRGFESGPDGVEILALGPHHEGDGELIPGWWSEGDA